MYLKAFTSIKKSQLFWIKIAGGGVEDVGHEMELKKES